MIFPPRDTRQPHASEPVGVLTLLTRKLFVCCGKARVLVQGSLVITVLPMEPSSASTTTRSTTLLTDGLTLSHRLKSQHACTSRGGSRLSGVRGEPGRGEAGESSKLVLWEFVYGVFSELCRDTHCVGAKTVAALTGIQMLQVMWVVHDKGGGSGQLVGRCVCFCTGSWSRGVALVVAEAVALNSPRMSRTIGRFISHTTNLRCGLQPSLGVEGSQ